MTIHNQDGICEHTSIKQSTIVKKVGVLVLHT